MQSSTYNMLNGKICGSYRIIIIKIKIMKINTCLYRKILFLLYP